MKVEFIKEVKNDGGIMYYTNVGGVYANNSLSHDSEKAMEMYEKIVAGTSESKITIIRTTIIADAD
jgi:hypothetical protein